jgi:hypothetical protein
MRRRSASSAERETAGTGWLPELLRKADRLYHSYPKFLANAGRAFSTCGIDDQDAVPFVQQSPDTGFDVFHDGVLDTSCIDSREFVNPKSGSVPVIEPFLKCWLR